MACTINMMLYMSSLMGNDYGWEMGNQLCFLCGILLFLHLRGNNQSFAISSELTIWTALSSPFTSTLCPSMSSSVPSHSVACVLAICLVVCHIHYRMPRRYKLYLLLYLGSTYFASRVPILSPDGDTVCFADRSAVNSTTAPLCVQ